MKKETHYKDDLFEVEEFKDNQFIVNVSGIVFDPKEKKILIARIENDPYIEKITWVFPGGLVSNQHVQLEDSLKKEIKEKTGYDIENSPDFWRKMSLRDEKSIKNATTHPTNPARYIALGKTIAEIKRKKKNGTVLVPNLKL